jgi:hypothetical protein
MVQVVLASKNGFPKPVVSDRFCSSCCLRRVGPACFNRTRMTSCIKFYRRSSSLFFLATKIIFTNFLFVAKAIIIHRKM